MKMKEFGPPGGAHPWHPSLDPPMTIGYFLIFKKDDSSTQIGVWLQ